MKLTENRVIALIVLVAVIAGSLILGGGGALAGLRAEVDSAFNASSESISAELNEMIANADVVASIAAKYDSVDKALVQDVTDAIGALRAAQTVGAKYTASEELISSVEWLYSAATSAEMSETDAADLRYKYQNFNSAHLRIGHDSYNEKAEAFNRARGGFPAALIAALRGIDEAELFG